MADGRGVVVIGAGAVGLCCAMALQDAGRRVVLLDPAEPGAGATAGNPGGISVSSVLPTAMPGIHRQVPGWLLDPLGPLAIRWRRLPAMAPWLFRFLRAARPERVQATIGALHALTGPAFDAYAPLLHRAGAGALMRRDGHLIVYRSAAALAAEERSWHWRAGLGLTVRVIEGAALRAMEPALDPAFVAARLVEENGHCSDPRRMASLFAAALQAGGATILRRAATGFTFGPEGVVAVRTAEGEVPAEAVVLAAGAHAASLAAQLGDRVPLEAERGYHVQIVDPPLSLDRPVFSPADKVFAGSMAEGLRFAGTAEFAGPAAPPDWRRADGLLTLGRRLFPALRAPQPAERVTRWCGFRPSTPDSLPVIGPSRRAANAFHAFGHGHIGLTTAAMTGRIIASLVQGVPPPVPLAPYAPARFRTA